MCLEKSISMLRPSLEFLLLLFAMSIFQVSTIRAEGDQFLDGIGETALLARYLFDGNMEDWSRNSLHASMANGEAEFVDDGQFGSVLALAGEAHGAYIRVPPQWLSGVENFSFSGWFKLDESNRNRCFLYMGNDAVEFCCGMAGASDHNPLLGAMVINRGRTEGGSATFTVKNNEWFHLCIVQDVARKKLSIYIDGKSFFVSDKVTTSLAKKLTSASNANAANIFVGGMAGEKGAGFDGWLHDIRFYRIALSDRQVAVIHHNAVSDDKWGSESKVGNSEANEHTDQARQLAVGLTGVRDVEVETVVGQLPHLPFYLPGIYRAGAGGPDVRVIWPAPRDNEAVRKARTYTVTGQVPGTDFKPKATVVVKESPLIAPPADHVLESFALGQVLLNPYPDGTPTPFTKHRDKFLDELAKTNPDTFLYNFRDAFGQPQPKGAQPLGVWDSPTCRLRGHASGHYLSAIAQAYAGTTCDPKLHAVFKQKMEIMVDVLYELSRLSGKPARPGGPRIADPTAVPHGPHKKSFDSDLGKDGIRTDYWNWGEGFISAYPPDQFIMLEQGASYGTGNNQVWAPYYTLHKILAGLMDCYELGGNDKALEVAKGMGLWVYKRLNELPQETLIRMWNSYIAGEYGGMNEAMARLFRITGDVRYLDCVKLFDNTEFFFGGAGRVGGLVRNVDTIRGRHANQHIPQITGALETYRDTRDPGYYFVARNFWNMCTHSYMYSIGGVAGARNPNNAECFTAEPDTLFRNGLSEGGQNETCATYNLLKLGRRLFMFEPEEGYMDYYERALYNDILASVAEHDAGNTYHIPLNPGAIKGFSNANMDGFTCCNGTALESATKLQNTVYLKSTDGKVLWVNLYIPSTLDWQERGVKITQETQYPYSDQVNLTVNGEGEFTVKLRVPGWATHGIRLWINNEEQSVDVRPGSYLSVSRNWNDGDTVRLKMAMGFRLMPLMDQPNIASIFYGPVLLAAEEQGARTDWRSIRLNPDYISLAFNGDPETLHFEADSARFKPFFDTYGHHSVYLNIVPERDAEASYPAIQSIDPPEAEFFARQLDFHGIPIKSSAAVDDRALYAAYDRLSMMLANLPCARDQLAEKGAELHIIGRNEVTTDLPEFRDRKGVPIPEYGGQTYDERTRGLGGLMTSCGEENLLQLPKDRYRGTDICIHEFSHNIMYHGSPPEIAKRFEAQRKRSLANGLWNDSYAGSNGSEFFAELAMWYFGTHGDVRMKGKPPAPGPEGLKAYDPEAYQLVDDFWSGRLINR